MMTYSYQLDEDEVHYIIAALKEDLAFFKDQSKKHYKKKETEDLETCQGFIDGITNLLKKMGDDPWE